jgi:hypothetical protein
MTKFHLIKKDGDVETFYNFADLYNNFLDEYGYPTTGADLQEGFELYYQGIIKS